MTTPIALSAAEIQARVLHRDALCLVIDKPAGIAVHPTAHDPVALDASFMHLCFGLPRPPALAHRLDRGTSGCLVLGRHRQATARLGAMFAQGRIGKTYLAWVQGVPDAEAGVIDRPILKSGQGSRWSLQLDPRGKPAVTAFRVLRQWQGHSLLELRPQTGRTHQLRLHCAQALHCPIVGDPFYGEVNSSSSALMLHAQAVEIPLYDKKPPMHVRAELPPHFLAFEQRSR